MEPPEKKPRTVDAQLHADSRQLLAEMEGLIGRARVLLLEKGEVRSSGTLGDVLYADRSKPRVPENDWVALVDAIAAGEPIVPPSPMPRKPPSVVGDSDSRWTTCIGGISHADGTR